jgi:hypothetical protein
MNTLSTLLILFFLGLITLLGAQILLLKHYHPSHTTLKKEFVTFCGLPDLAIANEALFVRFRSYADTFSLFSNGPELLEYAPSTFTYQSVKHAHPSEITRAH